MTRVELQIARAILIEKDQELEQFEFVGLPQAKGIKYILVAPAGKSTPTTLNEETATFYSVVETPRKRISETNITFYRDRKRRKVFVVDKNVAIIETLVDRIRAAQTEQL